MAYGKSMSNVPEHGFTTLKHSSSLSAIQSLLKKDMKLAIPTLKTGVK